MTTISSVHDMQMIMPRLLEQHGNNQELALIALANPIAALEKLGYILTDEAKTDLESYARFGKQGLDKYNELKEGIFSLSGKKFNVKSDTETAAILEKIINKKTEGNTRSKKTTANIKELISATPKFVDNKWTDKLEAIRETHAIVPMLIELRKMENSSPKFAEKQTLETIQKQQLPLTNIRFRLNRK